MLLEGPGALSKVTQTRFNEEVERQRGKIEQLNQIRVSFTLFTRNQLKLLQS